MTEREKMLAGLLYRADGPELTQARDRADRLCRQLNALLAGEAAARREVLEQLLGGLGERCVIQPGFHCDYGCNIRVGEDFYANYNCVILDCAPVVFGDRVLVAPNCGFYTAGHPLDAAARGAGLEFARPIAVGDDVWIGGGVSVLPGVTIGAGAVIGAGSVVSRDIPPNVIAAGNPCRVLREIVPEPGPDPDPKTGSKD